MGTRLSLRLRIFLFFCLLAAGAVALAGVALWIGWTRADPALPAAPFVTAFIIFALLNTALLVGVWLLFDENLAKPIGKLTANLRLRAHAGVDTELHAEDTRYLGDLGSAADAVTRTLSAGVMDTAAQVARETERLRSEARRLTSLLTEIPVATILVNPAHEIVLYDGQAADILRQIAQPRLKAPLGDYFDADDLATAQGRLAGTEAEITTELHDHSGARRYKARLKPLGEGGYMLFLDTQETEVDPTKPRPLVYDFDLMETAQACDIRDTPLTSLCCVAFDTETTGLSPTDDRVIQLGAVRILNGRIVEGETIDTYVDPKRPIPRASTKIHRITDEQVQGAPDFETVGRDFHHFARDAVLVAHNAPFDLGFFHRAADRMGVAWNHPVLDTVLLSAVVFGTTEQHSLDALCERLGVTIPPELRHTALGDAQATAQALVKLIPLLEGKGLTTFGAVIAETRRHGRLIQDLNTPRH
ncbi:MULTISPECIES: 3'-5' exonuclease [unclassified Roseovarius]|uniref:3'-5' exonuclease n=1 Tax=unclassified Roseovarius TaxID=2614913 RepID=UPI00273ED1C9|nr:3'-5' exonuclease [Roseovarius sp. MMSF_3350]